MELTEDIEVTHSFLNYLNAGYQGRFAYLNVLSQLKYLAINPETVSEVRGALDQISIWLNNLQQNKPLILARWTYPETQEAQKSVELFDTLQKDLSTTATDITRVFNSKDVGSNAEDLKLLLAAFARDCYSRDNYIREIVNLGELVERKDIVAEHKRHIEEIEQDIELVHSLLKTFQQNPNNPSEEFKNELINSVLLLPTVFLTHIHDINILLTRFRGALTFKTAGIDPEQQRFWEKINLTPEEAGYWYAGNFAPTEALKWRTLGFDYGTAGLWRVWGFSPDKAVSWQRAGFPVANALAWARAGYSTEESLEHIRLGHFEPKQVPKEDQE